MNDFLKKVRCLSVLMGNGNLQTIHPYLLKNPRLFAKKIKSQFKLDECLILSKCNCVEIYYVSSTNHNDNIISLWRGKSNNPSLFKHKNISEYSGRHVINHLFETACGLKSITLGDNQVIGQVHKAICSASEDKTTGTILCTIFNNARKVSNVVRSNTEIGKGNVSAERTAIDMMLEIPIPKEAYIYVVGAGSSGRLLCKILNDRNYKNIILTNRTITNADRLLETGLVKKIVSLNSISKCKSKPSVIFFATSHIFKKSQLDFLKDIKEVKIFDLGSPQNTLLVKDEFQIFNLNSINEFSLHNKIVRQQSVAIAKDIISTYLTKTIDVLTFRIKEQARRKHFHTNSEIYRSKIPNIKLKSDSYFTVRKTLNSLGFVEVQTPTIVAVPTDPVRNDPKEEIFSVNWYGRKMFLRQSNQLYKQVLALSGLDKQFELGPFWRAEQNPTPRHLSEAYGLDVEIAGIKNLNSLISLVQKLLYRITVNLYKQKAILKKEIVSKKIITVTYDEALDLLNANSLKHHVSYGIDFGYNLEEQLGNIIKQKYKTDVFAIINYPKSIKKFYTKETPDKKTLSFDIIYRGWEIVSGAIRETNYNNILEGIMETGLKYEKYQFYLNAFHNPRAHGGFCLGIDRFLVKLLGLTSLNDIFLFPRSEYDILP